MSLSVEAVYVVSLARRPDRLEAFWGRLPPDWPLPRPTVFQAVDGVLEERPAWWRGTPGSWGCYRSHRQVLEQAAAAGQRRILVLEDDVSFAPDFVQQLAVLEVPADAQQLYLGGQHLSTPEPGPPGLLVGRNVNRTHAYAVLGRPAIDILLDHLKPDPARWKSKHHIDHHLGILHRDRRIRCYCVQPWICGQAAGSSDVGNGKAAERWWQRSGSRGRKAKHGLPAPGEERLRAEGGERRPAGIERGEVPAVVERPGPRALPRAVADHEPRGRPRREEPPQEVLDRAARPVLKDVLRPVELGVRDRRGGRGGHVEDVEPPPGPPRPVSLDERRVDVQPGVGDARGRQDVRQPLEIPAAKIHERADPGLANVRREPPHERPAKGRAAARPGASGPPVGRVDRPKDGGRIHWVFGMARDFGGKPWSWIHHCSVLTAKAANPGAELVCWYEYEPRGRWWDQSREHLTLRKIDAPIEIHGRRLCHPAHRADVVRLRVLAEHGGTYIDSDVWCLRPFSEIRHAGFWMGRQSANYGLCNATMGGDQGAEFARIWLAHYDTFRSKGRDRYWDEHSVRLPLRLAEQHPDLVTIYPQDQFFSPLWGHLKTIFQKPRREQRLYLQNSISVHLWESIHWNWLSAQKPQSIHPESEIGIRLQELGVL